MATFVIVHGGWGGAWEWGAVASSLRLRGHEVFTPTLAGLGDRSHVAGQVDLETHVLDVTSTIEFERLHNVVLCGHSYGGMPATVAADRLADRVALLVYLDAFVPRSGESLLDLLWTGFGDEVRAEVAMKGDAWRMPVPEFLLPEVGCVPEPQRISYIHRLRPHPAKTFMDPVMLTGKVDGVRRAYIQCSGEEDSGEGTFAPFVARAKHEGWQLRAVAGPHDLQLVDPEGLAKLLDDLGAPTRH